MASFIEKMKEMMKLNDDYSEPEQEEIEDDFNSFTGQPKPVSAVQMTDFKPTLKSYTGGKKPMNSKVVNFQASVQMEVVVIQPEAYEEAQEICDHIKSQKPVIINLEQTDKMIAQHIMDFVCGSVYTLNGNLQRVSNNIFIIAPENVDIAGEFREELKSNGIILPWKSE